MSSAFKDGKSSKDTISAASSATKRSGRNGVASKHDLLNVALLPEDSYQDGVYWADLPSKERRKWINNQMSNETMRELKAVGRMTREDPLRPISAYFSKYVTTGMVRQIYFQ